MHVLLVDDEPCYRLLVRDALERADAVVDEVADGAAALARIRALLEQGRTFLLLTDYRMEGMDGLDLVAEARHVVPCLVMTSHCGPDEQARAGALGVEVVEKPRDPGALDRWVRDVVRGPALRSPMQVPLQEMRTP